MLLPHEPSRLDGPGLVLRGFLPDDRPALLEAFADEDIARWNPLPGGAAPSDAATQWWQRRNDWSAGDHASWAVADPGGQLLGSVSLFRIDFDQGDAEAGYWIAPWARGRGGGASALGMAARFAFGELGLHRVHLYHAMENQPSCRVAVTAGFLLEGTLRKSYRYADGDYHDEHLHGRLSSDPSD
jgi:RimJ/RimL family protein N-acetyltransferase